MQTLGDPEIQEGVRRDMWMLTVNKGKQKSAWSSRQDEREFSLFVVVSETMNQTTNWKAGLQNGR